MNLLANILAARGEDGNPELWFYLVLAIVFIGKSVISYLKRREKTTRKSPTWKRKTITKNASGKSLRK